MSLIVYDMGRRVETPMHPINRRVRATQASEATASINKYQQHDLNAHSTHTPPSAHAQQALAAYGEQKEQKPDIVSFIADIMHRKVTTLSPESTLEDAWELLRDSGFHHLPVISQDRLVLAIFSSEDFLHALARQTRVNSPNFWRTNIMEYASRPVFCVYEHTDLRQSSQLLFQYNIGALPVVTQNNTLCGIVTRTDIMRLLSHYGPLQFWA